MVTSIGSNLINMISLSYQNSGTNSQGAKGVGAPPPPPPPGEDPLGVFNIVDSDSDSTISESEFNTLTQGILEVTGTELNSSFIDFDTDKDGKLNGSELKSILDQAGFAPPPPPSQQVIAAYEAQSGEDAGFQMDDENMLAQLLEYLKTRTGDLDITA
ncbi:MAG: EF-hand domain-containing protein [Proteobacteria bacterium]|nr:EF-hand domain-containing protein [Desulfobacula sp.]MBU4129214.1 EF-hand domain-containing protein [Pseudomonadota bacterium]